MRVAGACSTAVLVPLSLGYITKVRSCARASEGNWVNGRTTRFCAACTTAPWWRGRRQSNSITILVGMLKFNRVSILSLVHRRKYDGGIRDTHDGLFPKVTHRIIQTSFVITKKTSLRHIKLIRINQLMYVLRILYEERILQYYCLR